MRAVGARGPGDLGLTPTAAERRRENLFEPRHPDTKKEASTKLLLINESDRRGSNPRSRPWQGRALPTTPLSHLLVCIALYSNFAYTRSHSVLIAKRVMGIEPTYPAWKAGVLPLNYTRRYSVKRAIDGARTRGLDLGKVARYQLRHYRIC